jgi:histidyl-tRNA synthetase
MKPSVPKGTRDFSPIEMQRRNYIFGIIRKHFDLLGFQNIETPAMETSSTLMGKYGEEGDRLIFKVLNSGDYLKKANGEALEAKDSTKLTSSISEKALRYDLTVPFARYVVQHQNDITFPFKRYQIQPVWRADRPQKGRYREFYQCDADVVGSDSLLYELEVVQLLDSVLSELKIPSFTIKINNRKILSGIAEVCGESEKLIDITVAIDKLDKIGAEGVVKELKEKGVSEKAISIVEPLFSFGTDSEENVNKVADLLKDSEVGMKGVEELRFVLNNASKLVKGSAQIEFDVTLARGLNYYTGAIFEVKANNVSMGSICGGGRYDDLTGVFGLPNVSGIGISFGADRIYDVLLELNLFPAETNKSTDVLFANFGAAEALKSMELAQELQQNGISAEVYPDSAKMKKQFKYADSKRIPFLVMLGSDELANEKVAVKNLESGEQVEVAFNDFVKHVNSVV